MSLDAWFQRIWYGPRGGAIGVLLVPLSWLFGILAALRRASYRAGLLSVVDVGRPVVVVGNITVGGTGKTPLTIWLANALAERQRRVGIVLRGYQGGTRQWPRHVTAETASEDVGDEAVLLARATNAIVVAGPDRVADARRAIELGADVVLSDDGLQHYRLARNCEIAVVDASRLLGNGRLLPAGPLREPAARLSRVDCVVLMDKTGGASEPSPAAPIPASCVRVAAAARLRIARSLATGELRNLSAFRGMRVHALAGIGNPQSFFDALTGAGLTVVPHPMDDHARLSRADVTFPDDAPILMTEKDAVRCVGIADARHWAVPMDLDVSAADARTVMSIVERALR